MRRKLETQFGTISLIWLPSRQHEKSLSHLPVFSFGTVYCAEDGGSTRQGFPEALFVMRDFSFA